MSEQTDFFIVGIGASAGGLEALQAFFSKLPDTNPAAFVIVQHLSPDFKSMMDELLAKHTRMPISIVTKATTVKPNHVYLMSPQKNLELKDTTLIPVAHKKSDKPNLPIDLFFDSLGKHRGANAVGVILSGTGTDGSRGIKTIKEQGGIIMVQTPESAKFDGMPNAALLTGLADFVLPLSDMAREVERIIHRIPKISTEASELSSSEKEYLEKILRIVAEATQINFSYYKEGTILRRMQKRMHITHVDTLKNYYKILADDPTEVEQLSNEFLIGVSGFFRDGHPWEIFREKVIPEIVAQKEAGDTIRVWVAGCSTGEEAYTIGMLLDDYILEHQLDLSYKVFGSDIDKRALQTAGTGVYGNNIVDAIPSDYVLRYFDQLGITFRVKKPFRDHFIFTSHNIITDPPFIRMDVVSCRNVLIYLNSDIQQKALSHFHFSLNLNGFLILGKSESIGNLSSYLTALGDSTNIFRNQIVFNNKLPHAVSFKLAATASARSPTSPASTALQDPNFFNNLVAESYDEAGVIVNSDFQILHVQGPIDRYFHFPKKSLRMYLEDVLGKDEYLLVKRGIREALQSNQAIYFEDVLFQTGQALSILDLRLKAIQAEPMQQTFIHIEFRNERPPNREQKPIPSHESAKKDRRLELLEKELDEKQRISQLLREELDAQTEEMQTNNEELIASNEELQSSNEELQSVNEELYSVNAELQEKIKEVTQINTDIVNLFNSTEIATIFIDQNFLIRRLTPNISDIININEKDIGRSIDHFTTKLDNVSFMPLARQVLDTGTSVEREVSLTSGKSCYLMRILPYQKEDGTIDGLVITFVDITEVNQAQLEVQNARTYAENIIKTVNDPLLVLDHDLRIISSNPAFYTTFKTSQSDTEGRFIYELGNGQWNQPQLHHLLKDIIPGQSIVTDYQIEHEFPDIGFRVMVLNAIAIRQIGNIPDLILLTIRDVTEKEVRRKQLLETAKRLNLVLQTSKIGTWEYDVRTQEVIGDPQLRQLFGLPSEGTLKFEDIAKRVHKEDYPRVYQALSEAIEQNSTYSSEFRVVNENGEIRYLTGHGVLMRSEEGEPYKILGINVDITERKRAEENIAHYGRLLEESYNEIYIFDAETLRFVNVNQGARRNLGYSMEELTELTPLDLKPEYDQSSFEKLIEPLWQGEEEVVTFETVHRRKDGSLYNVLVNLQLSTFYNKRVFIAIIQDTTEQMEARKRIRQHEERLAFAISGTSDGIWDWPDMQQETLWWSPRLYQLLGLEENEIEATISNYRTLVHPQDLEVRQKAFEAHIQHNKPFDITIRLKHKTKGYRWFRSRGQVTRDNHGRPLRMAGVVSDIHSQKISENRLKRTNRDLRIANEYLDNFVFTAAHDLRAPVANLKSLAGLLQSQKSQDNRVVEKIDRSIDRLEKTLRGLIKILDIQQSDRKEHTLLSFTEVLKTVLTDLEPQIAETNATISHDFNVKTIQYIEPYLVSILKNLLSNALKFRAPERPPKIHLRTSKESNFICLTIADNGTGINLERFQKKLFKPFERLNRTSEGLGIGLHIVKTIVEKNDGSIEVQSQVGQGTTFSVHLKPYSHEEENSAY